MRNLRKPFGLAMLLALVAGAARADIATDTLPSWNGSYNVGPFGSQLTATYAEKIAAPAPTLC